MLKRLKNYKKSNLILYFLRKEKQTEIGFLEYTSLMIYLHNDGIFNLLDVHLQSGRFLPDDFLALNLNLFSQDSI
jgi:hypothetical protein